MRTLTLVCLLVATVLGYSPGGADGQIFYDQPTGECADHVVNLYTDTSMDDDVYALYDANTMEIYYYRVPETGELLNETVCLPDGDYVWLFFTFDSNFELFNLTVDGEILYNTTSYADDLWTDAEENRLGLFDSGGLMAYASISFTLGSTNSYDLYDVRWPQFTLTVPESDCSLNGDVSYDLIYSDGTEAGNGGWWLSGDVPMNPGLYKLSNGSVVNCSLNGVDVTFSNESTAIAYIGLDGSVVAYSQEEIDGMTAENLTIPTGSSCAFGDGGLFLNTSASSDYPEEFLIVVTNEDTGKFVSFLSWAGTGGEVVCLPENGNHTIRMFDIYGDSFETLRVSAYLDGVHLGTTDDVSATADFLGENITFEFTTSYVEPTDAPTDEDSSGMTHAISGLIALLLIVLMQ